MVAMARMPDASCRKGCVAHRGRWRSSGVSRGTEGGGRARHPQQGESSSDHRRRAYLVCHALARAAARRPAAASPGQQGGGRSRWLHLCWLPWPLVRAWARRRRPRVVRRSIAVLVRRGICGCHGPLCLLLSLHVANLQQNRAPARKTRWSSRVHAFRGHGRGVAGERLVVKNAGGISRNNHELCMQGGLRIPRGGRQAWPGLLTAGKLHLPQVRWPRSCCPNPAADWEGPIEVTA
jgi:hypothetical protein